MIDNSPPPTAERTILVDPDQLLAVLEKLRGFEARWRPTVARRVLTLAMANLCPATGLIQLTRDQIARLLSVHTAEVSTALTALESLGAIRRERLAGRPAAGSAATVAFINPSLAWAGSADSRARWAGMPLPRDRRMQRRDVP